ASAERRPCDVCDAARAICQSSTSSVCACCGSRCFLRYVLMNVFVRIRYSHALRFVPGRYWWNAANAFANVSCTRSSASDGLRVIRSAAEYSWSRYCRASCSNRAARAASLSACGARLVSSVSVASTGTSVPSTGVVPDVVAGLPETSLPEIRSVINNEPSPPFVWVFAGVSTATSSVRPGADHAAANPASPRDARGVDGTARAAGAEESSRTVTSGATAPAARTFPARGPGCAPPGGPRVAPSRRARQAGTDRRHPQG